MYKKIYFLVLLFFIYPFKAGAVLPPDIIFSIGSSIYQIFAGLSIFLLGILSSFVPFLKNMFIKFKYLKPGFFIYASFIIFIVVFSFLFYDLGLNTQNQTTLNSRYFYYDKFILAGNLEEKPFLLDLRIIRREQNNEFLHYYSVDVIHNNEIFKLNKEKTSNNPNIITNLLFEDFMHIKNSDNSSRDKYAFSFLNQDQKFEVMTEELISDFVVKNRPEYNSYISVGQASLSINGKEYKVNIMHQGIFSIDYKESLYFDGLENIEGESMQFVLWDDLGEFYLFDQSISNNLNTNYQSHFWALNKKNNNLTQKAFSGNLFVEDKSVFSGSILDFSITDLTLNLNPLFTESNHGFVQGILKNNNAYKNVYGLGFYEKYGK